MSGAVNEGGGGGSYVSYMELTDTGSPNWMVCEPHEKCLFKCRIHLFFMAAAFCLLYYIFSKTTSPKPSLERKPRKCHSEVDQWVSHRPEIVLLLEAERQYVPLVLVMWSHGVQLECATFCWLGRVAFIQFRDTHCSITLVLWKPSPVEALEECYRPICREPSAVSTFFPSCLALSQLLC